MASATTAPDAASLSSPLKATMASATIAPDAVSLSSPLTTTTSPAATTTFVTNVPDAVPVTPVAASMVPAPAPFAAPTVATSLPVISSTTPSRAAVSLLGTDDADRDDPGALVTATDAPMPTATVHKHRVSQRNRLRLDDLLANAKINAVAVQEEAKSFRAETEGRFTDLITMGTRTESNTAEALGKLVEIEEDIGDLVEGIQKGFQTFGDALLTHGGAVSDLHGAMVNNGNNITSTLTTAVEGAAETITATNSTRFDRVETGTSNLGVAIQNADDRATTQAGVVVQRLDLLEQLLRDSMVKRNGGAVLPLPFAPFRAVS
jgi:hypothetical protein